MAGSPRVQLSLKGRLLSEVPFVGDRLRIGRMRENDVVVNNLAVSRFHAVLKREGDGYALEDLGSENGTQVNGERVSGTAPVAANDVIQLGKYELRIVSGAGLAIAGPPAKRGNDAWDASQTFLALDPPATPAAPARVEAKQPSAPTPAKPMLPPSPLAAVAHLAATPAPAASDADPDGVFAFGEGDLAAAAEPALEAVAEMETDPLTPPNPEHTSLFDFGDAAPAVSKTAALPPAPAATPAPATEPEAPADDAALHAGLIVQRDGKLHLLRPWDGGELCAGRAPECEIVLADAGVSRRHAQFSRTASGYEVSDLGSVNGIFVNGQRTKRHTLQVGDVVRIESFELTFVLDRLPIGSEVNGPTPAKPAAQDGARTTQFSLDMPAAEEEPFVLSPVAGDPNQAPDSAREERAPAIFEAGLGDEFVTLPPAADPLEAAELVALPEADVMSADEEDDEDEKDSTLDRVELELVSVPGVPVAPAGTSALALTLRFDISALSPRAREAFAVLADEGVAISARVEFRREA
jgi:pSer/pThr/pTyr-binding forkhead associated (FHA) protein